ncbi:MAG: HD domain-containing protein, partial [Thermoplasmata archaeon]|nr:HD domain-containing protein [Thermoplasmata archaeon]
MDGTFGVVNWFTKARESVKLTPVDTIKGVRETIKNDEPKTLEEFAQAVSETLQKTEGLSRIAADTRLPVCSLYHHLRNTTAIAVCRAIDEGWERKKVQALRTAALLHDIGKIESYMNHVESSVKIVEELMEP